MKRILTMTVAMVCLTTVGLAQETYENTKLIDKDLNGTARYVGMGGAMDALGADISTIATNPAGIGLFRKSQATVSFGVLNQKDAGDFRYGNKTNMSFDQIGFVYAMKSGRKSFLNVAFNYHKSKNFDYILTASDVFSGENKASQNTLSFIKAIGDDPQGALNVVKENNRLMGTNYYTSQLDNLYYNTFIFDNSGASGYNMSDGYMFGRSSSGYIGEYDMNISGNINDRVYLGLTVGIHDVHYKGISEYTENVLNFSNQSIGSLTVCDERRITGTGFDIKGGVIFRPMEESPFRIGISVATPTFYDLRTTNYTYLVNNTNISGYNNNYVASAAYDFKVYTPWTFGASIGHTIGDFLAIGASYEYADYSRIDTRVNDGGYFDEWWGDYYEESSSDLAMNQHTKRTLKGVSTFKLGIEEKPYPGVSLRLGYNYVSPMFKSSGYKDGSIDSYGSNYSSATDYTNWKATNRITAGVGYSHKNFTIDLACQYSATKGDFYPFMDSWGDYHYIDDNNQAQIDKIDNYSNAVKVTKKHSQLIMTLGYKF